MTEGRRVLTPEEVARLFKVSRRAVLNWVEKGLAAKAGIVPFRTPGGEIRFYEDEILAYIAQQRAEHQMPPSWRMLFQEPAGRVRKIVVSNQKGGVGKTTVTVNVAAALAEVTGAGCLVVDCDPQAHATLWLGFAHDTPGRKDFENSVADLWRFMRDDGRALPLNEIMLRADDALPLWLAPADLYLTDVESAPVRLNLQVASGKLVPGMDMRDVLAEFYGTVRKAIADYVQGCEREGKEPAFSYVFIDTPPQLSTLTTIAYLAADYLLIPVEPEPLALHGYQQFMEVSNELFRSAQREVKYLGVVVNHVKRLTPTRREMIAQVRRADPEFFFETEIPEDSEIGQSSMAGVPVVRYAPRSRAAEAFRQLALEIIERCNRLENGAR